MGSTGAHTYRAGGINLPLLFLCPVCMFFQCFLVQSKDMKLVYLVFLNCQLTVHGLWSIGSPWRMNPYLVPWGFRGQPQVPGDRGLDECLKDESTDFFPLFDFILFLAAGKYSLADKASVTVYNVVFFWALLHQQKTSWDTRAQKVLHSSVWSATRRDARAQTYTYFPGRAECSSCSWLL